MLYGSESDGKEGVIWTKTFSVIPFYFCCLFPGNLNESYLRACAPILSRTFSNRVFYSFIVLCLIIAVVQT